MHELISLMANVMSYDDIIAQIEESTTNYRKDPSEENRKKIVVSTLLIQAKEVIEMNKDGIEGHLKDINRIQSLKKLSEIKEQ